MTSAHTNNASTRKLPDTGPSADVLAERARALYQHAGPPVGTATAARLRAARQTALEAADKPHRAFRWMMMPAGAFAVAALAVVVVWQPLRRAPAASPAAHAVATQTIDNETELPPDADSADPALYQNLDFYAWLAQQPSTNRPEGG